MKHITIGEFLDYVNDLAFDNPDLLDLTLSGFVIDNEQVIVLEAVE